MIEISVVSPVYNSAPLVQPFVERVTAVMQQLKVTYEVILVDDRSKDGSWAEIEKAGVEHSRIRGVLLSRNFGQHYAISAGLQLAAGNWVVVMDSDLQDRPEEIAKLYQNALAGYEMVLARRSERKDSYIKVTTSHLFYKLFGYLTGTRQDSSIANFGIYQRKVIDAIAQMGDYFRVFPIMVQWVGFKKTAIDVEHSSRSDGKSNYNFKKLFKLAFDMIISFSEKPLRLSLSIGLAISFLSFCIGLIYLCLYFSGHIKVPGYTSLVLLLSFHLGLTISFVGVVGLYIGKVSMQVKNRPYFIVDQTIN